MWNRHYDRIVADIQELVDSGKVQAGTSVNLDTVPMFFLRGIPLVSGERLDRQVLELIEFGRLMQAKGYKLQDTGDAHPLASERFIRNDGKEADPVEIQWLRQKASQSLAKFPGRTRKIKERLYLHFEDYIN